MERSIKINKKFSNLNTKGKLLQLQGKTAAADSLYKQALSIANEAQLNTYGYELMAAGKTKEATDIFRMNVKKYPDSWNAFDSLAEALNIAGDKKGALANYKTALAKAPDSQKKRIEEIIRVLQN